MRCVLAPAGYGKTTMLHAAAQAATTDGGPVLARDPQGWLPQPVARLGPHGRRRPGRHLGDLPPAGQPGVGRPSGLHRPVPLPASQPLLEHQGARHRRPRRDPGRPARPSRSHHPGPGPPNRPHLGRPVRSLDPGPAAPPRSIVGTLVVTKEVLRASRGDSRVQEPSDVDGELGRDARYRASWEAHWILRPSGGEGSRGWPGGIGPARSSCPGRPGSDWTGRGAARRCPLGTAFSSLSAPDRRYDGPRR